MPKITTPRTIADEAFLLPVIMRANANKDKLHGASTLRRMNNDVCRECHTLYKAKYPGKTFDIVCEGIYEEKDVKFVAKKMKESPDVIRELLLPIVWAKKHINTADEHGDIHPFVPRDYQKGILACTATHKVDRLGRGLGKSLMGIIEELYKITTKKNYKILVLCPAKAQAQKWYDDLLWQCEHDAGLASAVKDNKQQPYFAIHFHNGSEIAIFTAGSAAGRGADSIRSQSPHRVRLEEQDLLNSDDYTAVMPLVRRYKSSEFHGSSTPTGARSIYWQMCTQFSEYREFYASRIVDPNWSPKLEETCRREARTESVYQHEFLAEFGDLEQGVFKSHYLDKSRYDYNYRTCRYNPLMYYFMGVDWNGQGTGTRIRILEYDPDSKMRKVVGTAVLDGPTANTRDTLEKIRELNRYWHCHGIYIDNGFGNVQDELLRELGKNATDADDKRLMNIKTIDFGANITTNKLVPNRGNSKYIEGNELERRTKPFMVEGAVMIIEQGLFAYSDIDDILDSQLRAYSVKTWSQHGFANTYSAGYAGDHDLDATMLALLGIELEFGLFHNTRSASLSRWGHAASFGGGIPSTDDQVQSVLEQQERSIRADVPSRKVAATEDKDSNIFLPGSHAAIAGPFNKGNTQSRVPSRTTTFRTRNTIVPSRSTRSKPKNNPFGGF